MNFELYNYKRALQQWRFLTNHLRRWMKNGHFENFSAEKKQQLATKLRHLYTQMLRFKTAASLRKALGSCAVLLGLQLAPGSLSAQPNFAPPQYDPFGLQGSEDPDTYDISTFGDLDGDGDLDILSIQEILGTQVSVLQLRENESTNNGTTPNFLAPVNVSPIWNDKTSFTGLTLGDIDNDGDLDVILGYLTFYSGILGLAFIENTGTASSPELNSYVLDPFGINPLEVVNLAPKLADLDGDGDLDLIMGTDSYQYGNETTILFLENTGTPDAPAFGEPVAEPFGLALNSSFSAFPELGDLDNDGDLDILLGVFGGSPFYGVDFAYFENTGSSTNPQFAAHINNPFGLDPFEVFVLIPIMGDLDNDGDLDILNGFSRSEDAPFGVLQWAYYENGPLDTRTFEPLTAVSIRAYPTVSHDLVQLELKAETPLDGLRMSLYRYDGTLLQEQALPKDTYINQSLHLGAYPAGMYVLKIHTATGAWTQQLIKQ